MRGYRSSGHDLFEQSCHLRRRVDPMCAEYEVFNLDRGSRLGSQVRVAGSSAARRRGLLGVDAMADGSGLWIAPCEAIHTFGMRTPIDAIFLDGGLRVRKLRPSLRPGRIAVCMSASSVLELRPGAISDSATELGDRLKLCRRL